MKEQKTRSTTSEEFSVEFGDVNGTKLFEFPLASKKDHKHKSRINKNKAGH
ncbi:MAG: hypothetical protein Q8935_14005 [Bacillota bacterium]|jgi:hypothetical protein|nr:hypothetical protein [Bacillota bacterium]